MKITQDVSEFAKEQGVAEEKASAIGIAEKAKEFVDKEARFIKGICLTGRRSIIKIGKYYNFKRRN